MLLKTEFSPAFLDGALKTIAQFCSVTPEVSEMDAQAPLDQIIAIAGIIGLTEDGFEGVMTIGFSEAGYLDLLHRMLGEQFEKISAENQDGAAEFANTIFGQAKVTLNETGHRLQMALPSVIRGKEVKSITKDSDQRVRYKFTLPVGTGLLEVSGRPTKIKEQTQQTNASIPTLDGQTLMHFVDAVRKTMLIQCGVEAEPKKPFKKTPETSYAFDVGAIIGLNGASFRGTLAVSFEEKVYRKVYYYMTKEKFATITPEMGDGASELTNIIFGLAKTKLNEQGYGLQMALPSLMLGPKMEFKFASEKPTIVLPFEIGVGKMWIEFAFDDVQ